MENISEVARLRAQIDEEREAMARALNGPAITAQHAFITARMENIGAAFEQLQGIIGDEEATEILVATMMQSPATENPGTPG